MPRRACRCRQRRGATFPVKLTLQTRDAAGCPKALAEHDMKETLDAPDDSCGCHSFFFVPKRGVTYRVSVQILRPGAPTPTRCRASNRRGIGTDGRAGNSGR